MENINKLEIVPDEVYEIGADKAPIIPEWSVKDDATLYKKVNKLAHSTFCGYQASNVSPLDPKKFVAEGLPFITDDGIASEFGSGVVKVSTSISNYSSVNFKCRVIYTSMTADQVILYYNEGSTRIGITTSGYLYFTQGTGSSSIGSYILVSPSEGDILDIEATKLNGELSIKVIKNNNQIYTDSVSNSGITLGAFTTILLGASTDASNFYFTGSIDLKQFSITVDGVPVFSGNKTGVDTIKPDDYTAHSGGTLPTISDDGIASNFTATSFIDEGTLGVTPIQSWKRTARFKTPSAWDNCIIDAVGDGTSYNNVSYAETTSGNKLRVNFAHTGDTITRFEIPNPSLNTWYNVEYGQYINGGVVYSYMKYKKDGDADYTSLTPSTAITALMPTSSYVLRTGGYLSLNFNGGEVDLNASKTYVDDNLVNQACLKIPYIEGQNYVKVVDKLYRDRVKDLFEQEGYNIYYTLGEDDFTLPSNKPNDIVKYKADGLTVAEQRADQTLTIRGACESGVDVNLPMDFFDGDSYAVFGVGTTGTNTASKFTPAADGNYIAIGKGKV